MFSSAVSLRRATPQRRRPAVAAGVLTVLLALASAAALIVPAGTASATGLVASTKTSKSTNTPKPKAKGKPKAKAKAKTKAKTSKRKAPAGFQAFQACLKAHGVTGGFRRGRNATSTTVSAAQRQKQAAAFSACRSKLPKNFAGGFRASPQLAAYRNCLKEHGLTLPKGRFGPGGFGRPGGTGGTTSTVTSTTTATQQAALKACAALRPARPRAGTPAG